MTLQVMEIHRVVDTGIKLTIPVMGYRVPAGFPSPADDYIEGRIDLNQHLIKHQEATFILLVPQSANCAIGHLPG